MVIALTGNYCFFNLLTIALCLLLIDDAAIGRSVEGRAPASLTPEERAPPNGQINNESTVGIRGDCSDCCHVANQRVALFQRVQAAKPTARVVGELLRKTGSISNRERLRTLSRDDKGPLRDSDRRQCRWH